MKVLLVHGGLYEPMDAARFWAIPGVLAGLRDAGFDVTAPDRLARPASWHQEAAHLAAHLSGTHAVVAGSNGCSAALRLALDYPDLVSRLVLCWPATAGDPGVDARIREHLTAQGVPAETISRLLDGGVLRGVADDEFASVGIPVAVVPSEPENRPHQLRTVEDLRARLPNCVITPGFPESPRPEFEAHRDAFVQQLITLLSAP